MTWVTILTDRYNYMGLMQNSLHEADFVYKEGDRKRYLFKHNGRDWELFDHECGEVKADVVNSPSHYALFDGVEAIEIIASSLTKSEFRGYCLGNLLKYRLRCGKKDNVEQELKKADKYKELFEKYKHLCKGEKN